MMDASVVRSVLTYALEHGAEFAELFVEDKEELSIRYSGGIVQGMSGSPIIQNGKLVGAVPHVFISDPTRGYGILIQDMLEELH